MEFVLKNKRKTLSGANFFSVGQKLQIWAKMTQGYGKTNGVQQVSKEFDKITEIFDKNVEKLKICSKTKI